VTEPTSTYPTDVESLAAALVAIESENPPGNERECAEYVHEWFTYHDIDATLVSDPDPDRPQVGARVGDGDTTLVLNGHIDVVPAGDPAEWSHDPYEPTVEEGRLYGRGSVDMKTGVALAMLTALDLKPGLEDDDAGLDGSIVVHAAMGEETAEPGTRALLEAGFDGDYGIVLEPTEFRTATSEKGLAWYELTVAGDPAHASRPDQGRNANRDLPAVLAALETYDERVRRREDDLVGTAYATVTQVVAGADSNRAVLPEQARITLDRRLLPEEDVDAVDEEVAAVVSDLRDRGVDLDWRRTGTYESAAVDVDCYLAETIREHAAAVADAPREPWGIRASTDVRNFVNDAGIEAVTWGPGSLDQAHTIDEYVELDAADAGLEILGRVARDVLAGE
jgi:succinyl-diaminopimelate desuccinylase